MFRDESGSSGLTVSQKLIGLSGRLRTCFQNGLGPPISEPKANQLLGQMISDICSSLGLSETSAWEAKRCLILITECLDLLAGHNGRGQKELSRARKDLLSIFPGIDQQFIVY